MNRKDLFKDSFKSIVNFTFQKADELAEVISDVWEEEKDQTSKSKPNSKGNANFISEKNQKLIGQNKQSDNQKNLKNPQKPREKQKKSKMFQSLTLPPGNSLNFFSLCTGCNECIFSCPYSVLFPVTLENSQKTYPFLDPNAKACKLCVDTPCISACPESALLPIENDSKPKFGKAVAQHEHCINHKTGTQTCNACETVCPIPKTVNFKGNLPKFSQSSCTGCGQCVEVCPSFPKAIQIKVNKITVEL
ncbi:MAG: 4Fe-4S binding protein [Leptospira sp.]|nr:4Fe-4S binding protein [Leptospira sp.]